MKQGGIGVQVHITASSAVDSQYKLAPTEGHPSRKRSVLSRCFPCINARVSSQEPDSEKPRRVRKGSKKASKRASKMWRFIGGVFQPVLGTANYLLSPTKPLHKPVVLPTGILSIFELSMACELGVFFSPTYISRFLVPSGFLNPFDSSEIAS